MNEQRTTQEEQKTGIHIVSDKACERCVLGTLMLNNQLYHELIEVIDEDCFYDETCKNVWKGIVNVKESGLEIDTVSLGTYFAKQGKPEMIEAFITMTSEASLVNAMRHAERLNDLRIRRNMLVLAKMMETDAANEAVDIVSLITDSKDKFEKIMGKKTN